MLMFSIEQVDGRPDRVTCGSIAELSLLSVDYA